MFETLRVEGFRTFSEFSVPGLSRINLFVGRNNAGKTSILEAIELAALGARPAALWRTLGRRGEVSSGDSDRVRHVREYDVRHLFKGHLVRPGSRFAVQLFSRTGVHAVQCVVRRPTDQTELQLFIDPSDEPMVLQMSGADASEGNVTIAMTSEGAIARDLRRMPPTPAAASPVASFLGTEGADSLDLHRMWDSLVLTPEEGRTLSALQIIEPTIERLAFTSRESRSSAAAFVKFRGDDQRVPLGSLGDGIRRLLALAIHIATTSGGVLLVDEIDTGLHYSALESMWRFLVESARRLNVQVFATSHSSDCVRALSWLFLDDPAIAEDVSVHRLERGAQQAVRYTVSDIEIAARHHIEIRG